MLRRLIVGADVALVGSLLACGGSPTSPGPTNQSRAALSITGLSVTGEAATSGYTYTVHFTIQNTGGSTATLGNMNVTLATAGGGMATAQLSPASRVLSTIAAGARADESVVVDDSHEHATKLTVELSYSDAVGTQTTTQSADVPALPVPPPPSTVTLAGIVTGDGAPLAGVTVEVRDGPDARKSTTSDSSGRYALPGLQPTAVGIKASKSGYDDNNQTLDLASNARLDFSMHVSPPPPPPVNPLSMLVECGGPFQAGDSVLPCIAIVQDTPSAQVQVFADLRMFGRTAASGLSKCPACGSPGEWFDMDVTIPVNMSPGLKTFAVWAIDDAGHRADATASFDVVSR